MLLNIRRTRSVSCDVINCQQLASTVVSSRARRAPSSSTSARISYTSSRASRALASGSFSASPHSAPTTVKVSGTTNCGSSAADARRGGRAERRLLDTMRALDLLLDGRGARGGGRERAAAVARGHVAPARLRPTVTRVSGAAACAAARRRATRRACARAARRELVLGRTAQQQRVRGARAAHRVGEQSLVRVHEARLGRGLARRACESHWR